MCFFFNDTATTEIYTLSLHDALPIFPEARVAAQRRPERVGAQQRARDPLTGGERERLLELRHRGVRGPGEHVKSEEHTFELQSRQYLVCRLLLVKKK